MSNLSPNDQEIALMEQKGAQKEMKKLIGKHLQDVEAGTILDVELKSKVIRIDPLRRKMLLRISYVRDL